MGGAATASTIGGEPLASAPASGATPESPHARTRLAAHQQSTCHRMVMSSPEHVGGACVDEGVVTVIAGDAAVLGGSPDGDGVGADGDAGAELVSGVGVGGLDVGLLEPRRSMPED